MTDKNEDFYQLCIKMAAQIEAGHSNSKRYTRRTLWSMIIAPVVLLLAMFVTGTSKISIMFAWLAFLFAACSFLIFLEYTDRRMIKGVIDILGGPEAAAEIQKEAQAYLESIKPPEEDDAEEDAEEENPAPESGGTLPEASGEGTDEPAAALDPLDTDGSTKDPDVSREAQDEGEIQPDDASDQPSAPSSESSEEVGR